MKAEWKKRESGGYGRGESWYIVLAAGIEVEVWEAEPHSWRVSAFQGVPIGGFFSLDAAKASGLNSVKHYLLEAIEAIP